MCVSFCFLIPSLLILHLYAKVGVSLCRCICMCSFDCVSITNSIFVWPSACVCPQPSLSMYYHVVASGLAPWPIAKLLPSIPSRRQLSAWWHWLVQLQSVLPCEWSKNRSTLTRSCRQPFGSFCIMSWLVDSLSWHCEDEGAQFVAFIDQKLCSWFTHHFIPTKAITCSLPVQDSLVSRVICGQCVWRCLEC